MTTPTESQIQQAVIRWWAMAYRGLGVADERLLYAYPAQGKRSPANAARMKAEGLRAGICDMFLAVPRGTFHGLFIEMKKPGGRLSPEQAKMIQLFVSQGYYVTVQDSFVGAKNLIEHYLRQT